MALGVWFSDLVGFLDWLVFGCSCGWGAWSVVGVLLAVLSVWVCLLIVLSLFSWVLRLLWVGIIYVFCVCYGMILVSDSCRFSGLLFGFWVVLVVGFWCGVVASDDWFELCVVWLTFLWRIGVGCAFCWCGLGVFCFWWFATVYWCVMFVFWFGCVNVLVSCWLVVFDWWVGLVLMLDFDARFVVVWLNFLLRWFSS